MSEPDAFPAAAGAVSTARAALGVLRDTEFWKITDPDLLGLARELEQLARLVFTAQVHLAGAIDTRGTAATHGAPCTAALLRATLTVSHSEARTILATAAAVLPRDLPTGGELPPVLPLLAQALHGGQIGLGQSRTIVATMNKLPPTVDEQTRVVCEAHLVAHGKITEPAPFAVFARAILLTLDQDGRDFDHDPPADHVEFTIGARNPNTGLTRITGQLDDLGVEIIHQAINPLAKPTTTPPATTAGTAAAATAAAAAGGSHTSGPRLPVCQAGLRHDLDLTVFN